MPSLRKMQTHTTDKAGTKAPAGKKALDGAAKGSKKAPASSTGASGASKGARGRPETAPAPGKVWEPPRIAIKMGNLYTHGIGHGIVFDTETTGLPNNNSRKLSDQPFIIEFGAHRFDLETGEVLASLDFLANPGFTIEPKIEQITGITNEMLKDKPPFSANFPELQDFFLGAKIGVGHNIWFDMDLLGYELGRMNTLRRFPWPPKPICTVEMSYNIKGHRLKLSELYAHLFNGETFPAHRAMPDVNACLRSFLELNRRAEKGK